LTGRRWDAKRPRWARRVRSSRQQQSGLGGKASAFAKNRARAHALQGAPAILQHLLHGAPSGSPLSPPLWAAGCASSVFWLMREWSARFYSMPAAFPATPRLLGTPSAAAMHAQSGTGCSSQQRVAWGGWTVRVRDPWRSSGEAQIGTRARPGCALCGPGRALARGHAPGRQKPMPQVISYYDIQYHNMILG